VGRSLRWAMRMSAEFAGVNFWVATKLQDVSSAFAIEKPGAYRVCTDAPRTAGAISLVNPI